MNRGCAISIQRFRFNMMNKYELMNAHAVKVNSGSGVLISALSQEYSYVLTAAHVIRNAASREGFQSHEILNHEMERINVIQIYFHPDTNVDCAVIKIPYQENISLSIYIGEPPPRTSLMMVGYPDTRLNEAPFNNQVKQQTAEFVSWVEDEIVISADGGPDKSMIDGFSGAGVYCLDNESFCLIAIEYSMDGAKVEEYFGRVKCNAIRWYKELVEHHTLASIMPSFLECFSNLKDKTFNYDFPGTDLIAHIKEEFGGIIDEILEDKSTKPSLILTKHESNLLFSNEHPSSLLDIRLWISYLEFMAISVLLDDPTKADSIYFSGLETKRRLVFSKSEKNWIGELQNLLELAGNTLDEGGSLIIDNCELNPIVIPPKFQIKEILESIARPRATGSRLKINRVSVEKYNTFKIAHIRALHKRCVIENLDEFYNNNSSEYIEMLRGFYNDHVN